MILVRSLLFTTLFFLTVIPYAIAVATTGLFSKSLPFLTARAWARTNLWLAKVLCDIDFELEGRENIPDTNGILYVKHQSAYEILVGANEFPHQCWVLKRELMWVPFLGWGLKFLHPIAINRSSGGRAVRQVVRQGRDRIRDGLWIVIYPEGTRVAPGKTRRYGRSGPALAKDCGCLILPVAHNAGYYWPRRRWRKYPGTVKVVSGPQIDPAGRSPEEINQLAQSWVEGTMRRISPEAYGVDPVSEDALGQA